VIIIFLPVVWAVWAVIIGLGWWLFTAAFDVPMPSVFGVAAISFAVAVFVSVVGVWVRGLRA